MKLISVIGEKNKRECFFLLRSSCAYWLTSSNIPNDYEDMDGFHFAIKEHKPPVETNQAAESRARRTTRPYRERTVVIEPSDEHMFSI